LAWIILVSPNKQRSSHDYNYNNLGVKMSEFKTELENLINRHSKENESDTPDFILAEYLNRCLEAFNVTIKSRELFYGRQVLQGVISGIDPTIYYGSMFVNEERSSLDDGEDRLSIYSAFQHVPIMRGTLTGRIFQGENVIQKFQIEDGGRFQFQPTDKTTDVFASSGSFDHKSGIITLLWDKAPGPNHLVVSYEYLRDG
jgi:hypothetical protein